MELAERAMKSMDNLSVPAAVQGVLALSRKLTSTLYTFTSSVSSAPRIATDVLNETENFTAIFEQLQKLLLRQTTIRHDRAAMIGVYELIMMLSGSVMAFTKLNVELEGLDIDDLDLAKWTHKESALLENIEKLAVPKTCLNLMLKILRW